jgi:hypothetical protein
MVGDTLSSLRHRRSCLTPSVPSVGMEISCDDCVMQDTPACEDCVVTFICGRQPGEAVVIDVAEARAVRLLGEAGLVPPLRRQARVAY